MKMGEANGMMAGAAVTGKVFLICIKMWSLIHFNILTGLINGIGTMGAVFEG